MSLDIKFFGGIVPRLKRHQLEPNQATIAHNIKLRNGVIEPWRELQCFQKLDNANYDCFHVHGCCVIPYYGVVYSAELSPDQGRYFVSGHSSRLETVVPDCNCSPTYYNLGVPAPTTKPYVSCVEECSRVSDSRSYCYTYVNKWFEESAPSPASVIVRVNDGTEVSVFHMAQPPSGYGITSINVYRASTAFRVADGKKQEIGTDFLYVGSVAINEDVKTTYKFTDTVKMVALGPVLETEDVRIPPTGLDNICAIDGFVRLAATRKNRVYFSENLKPYSWPVKYELTLDSTIIHMRQSDQKLFVTTDTTPYIIDASSSDNTKFTPVSDLKVPLPDIGCGYENSAIMTPYGMVYSSPIGAVLVDGKGKWTILTAKWFSEYDWREISPETARYGYYQGFLAIVTDKVSFLLDIDRDPYGDSPKTELVTISDKPKNMQTSISGRLFMLIDDTVYLWDEAETYREWVWQSGDLYLNDQGTTRAAWAAHSVAPLWTPVSVRCRTDGVHMRLSTPTGTEFSRALVLETPVRVPRMGRHKWYVLRLTGSGTVEWFQIGTSNMTVAGGR